MKKQLRQLILLLALLVVAAVAAWLLLAPAQEAPATASQESAEPTTVELEGTPESVQVRHCQGSYVLSGSGVDVLPQKITALESVRSLLSALNGLRLERVDTPNKDISLYGLDRNALQVELHYAGGESKILSIGADEPVSKRSYCSLNGEGVYLLDGALARQLSASAQEFISLQVTPPCLSTNVLSAVKDVRIATGREDIVIRAYDSFAEEEKVQLLSFGAVSHVVEGPGVLHELDRTYAQEIFESLLDMYAEDVVAWNVSDADLQQYGLDAPDMIVEFGLKNGDDPSTPVQQYSLRIRMQEDGCTYVLCNDRGAVYCVSRAAFMDVEYAKLVNRWFLSPLMADLAQLRVSTPDGENVYMIGGTTAEPSIVCNGETVDVARFRSFYTLAVSAASNGDYIAPCEPDGQPLLRLEFVYSDAAKAPDVLEMYDLDARRMSVSVNGVTEFAMRSAYVDALTGAMEALKTGAEIAQTW